MQDFSQSFLSALWLILSGDGDLWAIVILSLQVSLGAVVIAAAIGMPLGAWLAVSRPPGRRAIITVLNALMGLPPVVVGLALYLLLSRAGPLGPLELLYTPTAMIAAQAVLVTPIIAALSRSALEGLWDEYAEQLTSLGQSRLGAIPTLIRDGRAALITAALAGFGRAIAEVGAVLIVGGNINHATRVMTTTIALETSKGNLDLALALGSVLILIALLVNVAVSIVGRDGASPSGPSASGTGPQMAGAR
ncbi:ABC transporter permease [Profundibacterium mesophilum]|uniref:Binding-protein-dependent transport system inner membrane component ABC transporter integral membran n=1 Tax=Profundibacterium mesophilum KAUST100406-0324 TaxID=1037889 RepID=A0A921NSU6_9RHOB|nr:ABC transporter permease [Profundibacterium mesophilum]KAF0677375.1 Binding-protein-dependent transport system inner membrane component ABC transporter integral membran [Profundibacterium mesophilum KAUST100406-0324]